MHFQTIHHGLVALSLGMTLAFTHGQAAPVALKVESINSSLQSPWGLAFLPDGRMLVTEKAGVLKLLSASGQTQTTLGGLPVVNSAWQGGLLEWHSGRRGVALVTPHIPAAARIAGEKLHAVYNGGVQAFQAFMHQCWFGAVLCQRCSKHR